MMSASFCESWMQPQDLQTILDALVIDEKEAPFSVEESLTCLRITYRYDASTSTNPHHLCWRLRNNNDVFHTRLAAGKTIERVIFLGANVHLDDITLYDQYHGAATITTHVVQDHDSFYRSVQGVVQSSHVTTHLKAHLKDRAHCQQYLIGVLHQNDYWHHTSDVRHGIQGSQSAQHMRLIARDNAKAHASMISRAGEDSYDLNIHQRLRAMLFGCGSAVLEPMLEIETNRLSCSHGATCGSLPQDALRYMQARGLLASEAERLLLSQWICGVDSAFVSPFFEDACNSGQSFLFNIRDVAQKALALNN